MRLLGIDPGLRSTGWGVISVNGNNLQHVANGAVQPDHRLPDADRLAVIYKDLADVISDFSPDRAAVEQIFVAKSASSALRLGMARGVGILICGQSEVPLIEISARAVKKAVSGSGRADKSQVKKMVTRLLSTTPFNEDASDALAVAIAAANNAGKLASLGFTLQQDASSNGLSTAISDALRRENASKRD